MPRFPTNNDEFQQQLILSEQDKYTLIVMGIYVAVIFVLWYLPYLKHILTPFKLIVTAFHELGHAIAGKCTGAKIESITIDADTGGLTKMRGGKPCCTLPAGGLMIFCGFDRIASIVMGAIIAACLVMTLWWARNWIARTVCLVYLAALGVMFWWNDQFLLPYFVLFLGLQSLWDFQGLILFKHPQSDATKFSEQVCRCCPGQVWAFIWLVIAMVLMGCFIFLGVLIF